VQDAIGPRTPRRDAEGLRPDQRDAGLERSGEIADRAADHDLDVDCRRQRAREAQAVLGNPRLVGRPRRDEREPPATPAPGERWLVAARGVAGG
jgi:hypothetical protein